MTPEARITVRNAGWLLIQRSFLVLSGLLFAAVVPRLMGPGNYGRFALVSSLVFGFVLFSNLGTTQIMGRFVPELKFKGDLAGIRKLFSNLLTLCLAGGCLAACLYFALTALWLRDLDRFNLLIMSIAVLLLAVNQLVFALFLGLNQAARWGLGDILRRWITLLIVVPGFYLAGLPGACCAVLLAELVLAAIGLCFARDYLARPQLDTGYLAPYLQFGLVFYGSSLLYNASERSSEALVRLASGSYIEVGYFSLAYAIYQMAVLTISQLTLAFAPLLAMLRTQGHEAALRDWTERLLKWFAIAAVLLIYGTLFLAEDLVPPVFGAAYLAVAGNLIPLMVALLFLGLSQVANLLALVYELPHNTLSASALRLVALWTLGLPLAAWRGSFGACLANCGGFRCPRRLYHPAYAEGKRLFAAAMVASGRSGPAVPAIAPAALLQCSRWGVIRPVYSRLPGLAVVITPGCTRGIGNFTVADEKKLMQLSAISARPACTSFTCCTAVQLSQWLHPRHGWIGGYPLKPKRFAC